jgi:hypothetical protein
MKTGFFLFSVAHPESVLNYTGRRSFYQATASNYLTASSLFVRKRLQESCHFNFLDFYSDCVIILAKINRGELWLIQ